LRKPPHETAAEDLKPFASNEVEEPGSASLDTNGAGAARPDRRPHIPERTCILTRKQGPRPSLIRLALGPDGVVAPDIRARAPGRGAWIGVDRAALEAAQAKGKLKAALSRGFKTGELSIPADLPARIEIALRQAVIDRLGLEAKAGHLAIGGEKIDVALRRGQVSLLIHAADAGADGRAKLDQALRVGSDGAQRQGLVFPEGRAILSMALGRQNVVHVAVLDRAAAQRLGDAIARWGAFIGRDGALGAAAAAVGVAAAADAASGIEGQE
jgi:uncharacterized protein